MKPPEEYFQIRKQGSHTIYEWRENARLIVASLMVIALLIMAFVKTFIEHAVPLYVFIITLALGLVVIIFFRVYDRFRLAFDTEGVFVARGISLFLGSGLGTCYHKKDFEALYTKSPSNFNNFDFGNDTKIICLQLKNNRRIRLTNALLNEYADFLIDEMKVFFLFSEKPTPINLKMVPKLFLIWAIAVITGVVTPRLLEVGEYALEKQSGAMRVASGLLGMVFIIWILTSTDAIFKEKELSQLHKTLIFVLCLIPTALVLGYIYLL
ncbi:hypothetical protein [Fulvivirga sp.]|uniref:hypothetical protein n=1 Tax=Fulvivirga sp. TaxID=1931237 RepID=UPI0032EC5BAB